jgi:hypothetical protein
MADLKTMMRGKGASSGNLNKKQMLAFGERAEFIILELAKEPFEHVATSLVEPYTTVVVNRSTKEKKLDRKSENDKFRFGCR